MSGWYRICGRCGRALSEDDPHGGSTTGCTRCNLTLPRQRSRAELDKAVRALGDRVATLERRLEQAEAAP